jgi:radical SAM superfamily enzyme YgiQ (UPF0313 family)
MKILFVRPKPSAETIGLQHVMILEPLELEVLYTLMRSHDEGVIVDMILERKPLEYFIKLHRPDLICITGYITHVGIMIDYCRRARRLMPEITTIVGGVHCEVCPEDFEDEAVDYRAVRNAAVTFTSFLNSLEGKEELPAGILRAGEKVNPLKLPPFDFRVPIPDRTPCRKYRDRYFFLFRNKIALLKTSFGCPYQCAFCFCRKITEHQYVTRSIAEVIDELKTIDLKEIYIVDDDFLVSEARLREFLDALRSHKIRKHFLIYSRADFIARHPDLIDEFAQLGLKSVIVGFESFSDEELDIYHKNTSANLYADTMKVLNANNIDCFATIIVNPDWGRTEFDMMIRNIRRLGVHYVNLQPLTPLPATDIHFDDDQLLCSRKEYEMWDLAHVIIPPTAMSVSDFYGEIIRAYKKILFNPRYLHRYLLKYNPAMLFRMISGSTKVEQQYQRKRKEAQKNA